VQPCDLDVSGLWEDTFILGVPQLAAGYGADDRGGYAGKPLVTGPGPPAAARTTVGWRGEVQWRIGPSCEPRRGLVSDTETSGGTCAAVAIASPLRGATEARVGL